MMNHLFYCKQMIIWLKPAATKQQNPKLKKGQAEVNAAETEDIRGCS